MRFRIHTIVYFIANRKPMKTKVMFRYRLENAILEGQNIYCLPTIGNDCLYIFVVIANLLTSKAKLSSAHL